MLTALAMAALMICQTPSASPNATTSVGYSEDRAADEAAIRQGAAAWAGAFTRGDVDLVDRLLADDFVGTAKDGTLYDKPTMLGWVRTGPNLTSSDTTVEQVRFFGDIAVATGSDAMVGPPPGLRRIRSIWTDIWIRRDGQWRVIAAHDMAGAAE
jgi:ketosteroid isomerase-like protein